MKVFLSWSGERSHAIATALRDWLPKVIQALEPWMSAVDIERGARWGTDIAKELEDSQFGIICLTPTNLNEPWIHFEAGALSKTVDQSYVCPFINNVEPSDLTGPLVQFNAARTTREDTEKLINSLNSRLTTPLASETVCEAFAVWWPKLEEVLENLPAERTSQMRHARSDREIIEELLELSREQNKGINTLLFISEESEAALANTRGEVGFRPGTHVKHEKYGRGLVLRREGKAPDEKLTVSFPGFGQKKLLERFANLRSG
ncbi:MAG: TIR domain-containing protein [Chloracidobacterium sp.]|nr:TIR domain-containing protein [Chloracidobacterium sp.]